MTSVSVVMMWPVFGEKKKKAKERKSNLNICGKMKRCL